MNFNQKISTKFFIISHILLLISGLIFLGWLYYILYLDYQPFVVSQLGEKHFTGKPKTILIDLLQPENNDLIFESSILVSGKTNPNMDVLIMNESEDLIIRSKSDGNFSATVDLVEGVNTVVAVTFDESGNARSSERNIYYSKEKI